MLFAPRGLVRLQGSCLCVCGGGVCGVGWGGVGGGGQGCLGRCVPRRRSTVEGSVASQDATWGGFADQKEGAVASQDAGYKIGCVSGGRFGGLLKYPSNGGGGGGGRSSSASRHLNNLIGPPSDDSGVTSRSDSQHSGAIVRHAVCSSHLTKRVYQLHNRPSSRPVSRYLFHYAAPGSQGLTVPCTDGADRRYISQF